MSHYTVLVIPQDDLDSALAPFDENDEACENPKWDWWTLGGRWSGTLKLKDYSERAVMSGFVPADASLEVDGAPAGVVDWEATAKDRTDYAGTFALLTPEGEWLQRGEMGWWATVDPDKATPDYNARWWEIVRGLPPEQMVYIVDCHI